jgi:hypothetical protein
MWTRGRITFLTIAMLGALGTIAGQAGASHAGAIANCGTSGTFTVKAAENNAGFQSPLPTSVIVFEEGGALTVQQISRDGQLLFTRADMGRVRNSLTEVTCSITTGSDGVFTVTGILTGYTTSAFCLPHGQAVVRTITRVMSSSSQSTPPPRTTTRRI